MAHLRHTLRLHRRERTLALSGAVANSDIPNNLCAFLVPLLVNSGLLLDLAINTTTGAWALGQEYPQASGFFTSRLIAHFRRVLPQKIPVSTTTLFLERALS